MKLHSMWQEYPALQADLSASLQLMEKSLKLKNKEVEQAILSMIHSGGKLLRPAYQLLFSAYGSDKDREKAVALAATTISSIMRTPAASCRPFVPNLATMSLSMLVITSSSAALN